MSYALTLFTYEVREDVSVIRVNFAAGRTTREEARKVLAQQLVPTLIAEDMVEYWQEVKAMMI